MFAHQLDRKSNTISLLPLTLCVGPIRMTDSKAVHCANVHFGFFLCDNA